MLNRINVWIRLYGLIAFLSLIVLIVGALGLYSAGKSDDSLDTVYKDRVVPLKDLKVIADMYAVNIVDTSHKVRNGNISWADGRKNVADAVTVIDRKWKEYLATTLVDDENRLITELTPRMKKADAAVARLQELLKQEDTAGLADFTVKELYPVIDPVSEKLSDLVDVQLKVAKEVYDTSSATYHRNRIASFISIIAGVILACLFGHFITRSITGPLAAGAEVARRLAQGDLSVQVQVTGTDETGQLMAAMRQMTENLRSIISQVSGTSDQVAAASQQLHATAGQIADGAGGVAAQAATVATAGEEMSATSGSIAMNCQMAAEGAHRASEAARNGVDVVKRTVTVMEEIARNVQGSARSVEGLGTRSDQIGAIIGTIEDIADQTNLLALNAAIEAARAGEQGRGFAVVADEVRALAERTTRATKEIDVMIKTIQKETMTAVSSMEEGVRQVESGTAEASRSGEALQEILDQISEVALQVQQIATAAEEQTATTGEISGNILKITEDAGQTSHGAQDTATAAAQLSSNAAELQRLVQTFRL